MSELLSVLRDQTHPNVQHAARQHASFRRAERAPSRRLRGGGVRSHGWAEPRCCASLTHTNPGASSADPRQVPQQGSYLTLAGEFSRTLRPDEGLGFLFSRFAMTPLYSSAISSSEHEQPPRKHLSGLAMPIQ